MCSASAFLILSLLTHADPSVQATKEVLETTAENDDGLLKMDAPMKTDPLLNLKDSANVQPPSESGNCNASF